MSKSTARCRTRQQENAVHEQPKLESLSSSARRTRLREHAVDEQPKLESPSSSVRRTRNRGNTVDEQSKILESPSSLRRTHQRDNALDNQPKLIETPSSSVRCTRQRQGDAGEQKTVESLKRKSLVASEFANGFLKKAEGSVAYEGQSPSRKKIKAPAPEVVNKLEDDEGMALDLQKENENKVEEEGLCEEPAVNSSDKKKWAAGKKVVKRQEESSSRFAGDPVPVSEAQMRWPERYTKKAGGRKSLSSSVYGNEGDDEPAKAKLHYHQAMVDDVTYNLNDDVHVKAGDDEPNYIGRIIEFFETIEGKLYFRTQWFYKAEDTVISYHANDHDKRRVFLSEDQNDNELDCIVSKIRIIRIKNNIGLPIKDEIPECDYYYDMSYSPSYSTFASLPKDDTSGVSSLSTTSSEEGFEQASSSTNANLLDLYSGCGAMSTGLCNGAQLAGLNLHTTWAVDLNSFACQSLRLNHLKTKVRNERAEDFLVLLREWKKLCENFSLDVKHPPKPNKETDDLSDDDGDIDSTPVSEGEFEVDHFVDICFGDPNEIGKKELMFKVRWKGYGASEDTWEPISGLRKCSERIENFVRKGYRNKILPLPGVVDVICGGPPCQGISGFNRFRDFNNPLADIRNQQMAVFMEIVDFLKPKFVLMENVVDILKFAEGYLGRFALSKLVKMNYQSRLGIMAAGCYGLPQFRMRVFLWGAQPSEVLPQFPLPTHDVLVRGGAPVKFEVNDHIFRRLCCLVMLFQICPKRKIMKQEMRCPMEAVQKQIFSTLFASLNLTWWTPLATQRRQFYITPCLIIGHCS
ncbi:DNA (cytosine-5)-methyltransferase CMT1-like isoform X2 [Phalaenopsis equestris]|uniref:DNA (cytosine-5)-methyltransferase CMT1-like isoform X2 n=1 Tax=Phalaenopsis equestris TaxID=78828 RepID=UPI0009E25276|nr:DNA (cytosine-5)-methyltransferase CMT1-like isoform X2 [Phalaenopsis equestris]